MIISSRARRYLALLSACGLVASMSAYVASFFGETIELGLTPTALLFFGAIALVLPIRILEPSSKWLKYFWTEFIRGMPGWVLPMVVFTWLIAISHFVWFLLHSGLGAPEIRDGQYVVANREQVFKLLTRAEYVSLKEAQVRMFATMMISIYFGATMFWWFRRNE